MLSKIHPLVWIAAIPLLALVPAGIAYRRGYPFLEAWLVSILFPPMALVIAPFLPAYKVCHYCLERIKAGALACRHCGRWQDTSPDPLTQSPPSQHPANPGKQEMTCPGEQRPVTGLRATEKAFDDGRGDRRTRCDQARRSAGHRRWRFGRLTAVAIGLLAVGTVAVFLLPEARHIQWGEAKHPADAADGAALIPNVPGAVASASLGERMAGGPVGTRQDNSVEIDAAAKPRGLARREPALVAAQVQAAPRLGGGPGGGQDTLRAKLLPARLSTPMKPTADVIALPIAISPTNTVQKLQATLTELGYDPGPVDGILGEKTKAALLRYRTANELSAGGSVDVPFLAPRAAPVESEKNQVGPISLVPNNMFEEGH